MIDRASAASDARLDRMVAELQWARAQLNVRLGTNREFLAVARGAAGARGQPRLPQAPLGAAARLAIGNAYLAIAADLGFDVQQELVAIPR